MGIHISGLLGQVIRKVLPDPDLTIDNFGPPDVFLVDLDQPSNVNPSFTYDGNTPVVGLTFSNIPMAFFEPRLIFFDCPYLHLVRKPFNLLALRTSLRSAPDEFRQVYSHPGINLGSYLLYRLKSGIDREEHILILRKISQVYPGLTEECQEDLHRCLAILPNRIVSSFYADLAHKEGHEGLEGQLGLLAGAANDYAKRPHHKETFDERAKEFLLRTDEARSMISRQAQDFKNLLSIWQHEANDVLTDFNSMHQTLTGLLVKLEACLSSSDQKNPKEIAGLAIQTGLQLRAILNKRNNEYLKGRK